MNLLPLLFVASTVGDTPHTPEPEIVLRVYDLGPATPTLHAGEISEVLLPHLQRPWDQDELLGWEVWDPRDDVVEILREAHASEFEYEGRSIQMGDDDRLYVAAPQAVHQSIERILTFLESAFGRSLELRIDVLELAADVPLPTSAITLEAAEKLVASAPASGRRSQVVQLGPGRLCLQDASRELEAIADFDVEIAQAALAYDPIATSFSVGSRIAMRAAVVPGGVRLACLWKDADSSGLEEQELRSGGTIATENVFREISGPSSLQTVSVLHRSLALSTFLPRGHALVVASSLAVQTGASRQLVVLRIQGALPEPLATLPARDGALRIELLDAGFLSPPSVRIESELLGRGIMPRDLQDLSRREGVIGVLTEGSFDPIEEQLFDDRRSLRRIGAWFVIMPSGEGGERAAEGSGLTPDSSLFQLAQETRLISAALTLKRVGPEPAVLARWTLPLVAGEECAAILAGERLIVGDNDVEVAQGASVSDPQLFGTFDGLALRLRPSRSRDGGLTLDLSVLAHVLRGPPRRIETGDAGGFEQGTYDRLFLSERLRFAADATSRKAVLGESSATPTRAGLALEVELR